MAEKQLGVAPSNSADAATKAYVDSGIASIANKTLDNTNSLTVKDNNFILQDDGDATKQLQFQLSGITTGTTRTLTVPNANTTIVGTDATQTLTNKTIQSMSAGSTTITSVSNPSNQQDAANKDYVDTVGGFQSIATAAGTTTLTVSSPMTTQFTGTTTQTVVLPNATTLSVGRKFVISNRSTGSVQVNANGGGALQTMFATSQATFTLSNNGTSAGTWDISYLSTGGSAGAPATATVSTSEATTSTSFTDLTTTTDSVTVTIGSSGMALVTISHTDTASQGAGHVSYAISGANTASATDTKAARTGWWVVASGTFPASFSFLETGLAAGSTTFKMKYRTTDGSSHSFSSRSISVIPINNTNLWAGQTQNLQGAYASLPTAGAAGRIYYANDIGLTLLDNGSTWDRIGVNSLNRLTVPPSSGWTTINGPSATFSTDLDGRKVTLTANARSWAIEYRTPAATSNYTVTAWFDIAYKPGANQLFSGLILRDSSSGALINFGPGSAGSATINVMQWSSATAWSSTPAGITTSTVPGPFPSWYRVRDDGTNRYYECSHNGVDWWQVYSHARGSFITDANLQIGWGIDNEANTALTVRMRSFKES